MRTFVGVDLTSSWREALGAGCEAVRELAPGWRDHKWVLPENLHLTLKFFGDLPQDAAQTLPDDLSEALAGRAAFDLPVLELFEAVPNRKRATMLWTTLSDADGLCADLAQRVETVAERYGVLPDTRDFRAHVTLCRARRPRSFTVAAEASSAALDVLAQHGVGTSMSVRDVTVYKSTLTRSGAHYERLCVLRLSD